MKKFARILSLALACLMLTGMLTLAHADDEWVCPSCGRVNPGRANFCGSCREPKPTEAAAIPIAHANAWICSGCGEICPAEDVFCMICGTDRRPEDASAFLTEKVILPERAFEQATVVDYVRTVGTASDSGNISFTAPVTGTYFVWVREAVSGFRVRISVTDASGYSLSADNLTQGNGSTVNLKAGQTYTITQEQRDGSGSYTMSVGIPRDWADISNDRIIYDSMSFAYLENRYKFTAPVTGKYFFWISQADNGVEVRLTVYDKGGYSLSYDNLTQGYGINVDLKAGETYDIVTQQRNGLKDYTLRIGAPCETIDVSGCAAVGDRVWFHAQQNKYAFTVPEDAKYTLTVGKADSGVELRVSVYDEGGYQLNYNNLTQGGRITVNLSKNIHYTIVVEQRKNNGEYVLNITK